MSKLFCVHGILIKHCFGSYLIQMHVYICDVTCLWLLQMLRPLLQKVSPFLVESVRNCIYFCQKKSVIAVTVSVAFINSLRDSIKQSGRG